MDQVAGLTLVTGDFQVDRAFHIALGDIAGNVMQYHSGLLAAPAPCLVAGLSYPDPWTRDAAINTWNGAGMLLPTVARNTLYACLTDGTRQGGYGSGCGDDDETAVMGHRLRIGGQYWDRIIWTLGAWAWYCQNGDREFLRTALEAVRASLAYLESTEFDATDGLFRGGACFHDGIGAYGDVYAEQSSGCIMDWPRDNAHRRHPEGVGVPMKTLSTNCLYAEAYRLAGLMARELGVAPDERWTAMRETVTRAIREQLWLTDAGHFRFYLDPFGNCGGRQEALGNALAVLFGIVSGAQADTVCANQPYSPAGPPTVWPDWERYANATIDPWIAPPGREDIEAENVVLRSDPRSRKVYAGHGASVWPFIQGFWGEVHSRRGDVAAFSRELRLMAGPMCRAVQSPEVVHPDCGLPCGGIQERAGSGRMQRGVSCYRQTWSATAYVRVVLRGIFGLDWWPGGLRFAPCLPEGIASAALYGLPWREARLDVLLRRTGETAVRLDGQPVADGLPAGLSGSHTVELTV